MPTQTPPNEKREQHSRRRHPPTRSIAIWLPILIVALLSCLLVFGIWRHVHERHEEEDFAKKNSQITVEVSEAKRDRKPKTLSLPGNFEAFQQATLYPRSNGYVGKWYVDIGDDVKEGQLLATIETPEVDQQLAQAQAAFQLADATAKRWQDLAAKKVVSDQDRDEKETAKRTSQANLEQLQKTQGFNKIVAPFGGKISARRVDVGALVSPTTPLFDLVQSDPLRIYVYAPQSEAPLIREGLAAKVSLAEFPGQQFDGTVTRTAGALDAASRAMQAEVQVPNHEGKLFAGMYGDVNFTLANDSPPLTIPATAFLFKADGPQVATVTDDKKIQWQTIKVGRDFGTELEVLDGINDHAKVVTNPTDQLIDGLAVEVKKPSLKSAAPNESQPPKRPSPENK